MNLHSWVITHTTYSPDLTICDFFLFPTFESDLKGRRFESPQPAFEAAASAFKNLTQNEFQRIFGEWQRRWAKCAALNGEYLEGAVANTERVSKIWIFFKIVPSFLNNFGAYINTIFWINS